MLNPLIRWEPGLLVRYHGSLTELHGTYASHLCPCRRCDHPAYGSARFRLLDEDGATIVSCVRPASITPRDAAAQPRTPRPAQLRCARGHFLPADFRPPSRSAEEWDDTCRCDPRPTA